MENSKDEAENDDQPLTPGSEAIAFTSADVPHSYGM